MAGAGRRFQPPKPSLFKQAYRFGHSSAGGEIDLDTRLPQSVQCAVPDAAHKNRMHLRSRQRIQRATRAVDVRLVAIRQPCHGHRVAVDYSKRLG